MKRPLILFIILFIGMFALFASLAIDTIHTNAAIARSPAYAMATPVDITKISRKRSVRYQVNYTYQVAGSSYPIHSGNMDQAQAQAALTAPGPEIVYASDQPAVAAIRSDFERRDLKQTMAGMLMSAAGLALLIAFAATLLLRWKFSWLRAA